MKLVFTHQNPALVGLAKSMLESSGIAVSIKNEFTAAGMSPPYNINQELMVLDSNDYDQAQEILESLTEVEIEEDKPVDSDG